MVITEKMMTFWINKIWADNMPNAKKRKDKFILQFSIDKKDVDDFLYKNIK